MFPALYPARCPLSPPLFNIAIYVSQELGAPIPSQIADRLRGREFSTFADFRRAFWMEVANDPTLSEQFSIINRQRIAEGKAPVAISSEQVGGRERFELHHAHEIQHGGAVYDMDNLRHCLKSRRAMARQGKNQRKDGVYVVVNEVLELIFNAVWASADSFLAMPMVMTPRQHVIIHRTRR
ncbi:hypothetical protein L861_23355 [Litchfieldella anticariensis FP35 = DSM 16096]|uniref:Uncharacterized protein n=1 Tax=Litchfieldella anticariensis (strain DSM 16096 / CECT 5854 / CIP 108499 / LMG 22089 / FP35) TaxID=1121939 RepID=S2KMV0_LITA3|nr:hypothetical protein L861_23355 [Halomonas anticariensis FP35 = DSM 16096]